MKLGRLFAALAFTAVSYSSTVRAEVRIVTVDVGRILNESPEALTKKKELDALSQDTKKKIDSKGKEIEALKTKLRDAKASDDSKEAEAYRNKVTDYQRFVKDADDDLKRKYMKFNKEMTDKVMGRIEAYAKSNSIDLVLEKSDKYRGPVLFGAPAADITDDLLKNM